LNFNKDIKDYVINIRRKIHACPELGFQEFETQKLIIRELEKFGIKYKIIGTGVFADIGNKNSKKIIAFRADMDALPIQEETGVEYSSKNANKMHACGHDNHVAILLGFAKEFSKIQNQFNGKIRLIFQPNEEGQNGAKSMINGGALENVKYIFGFHVKTDLEVGSIGLKYDGMMACVDEFKINLLGKGGHGAISHKTIDIILLGSQIVQALNCIISRNINPVSPAVLSVCKFLAGHTFNVIPSELELAGTIRTFDEETQKIIHKKFYDIVENFSKSQGAKFKIEINKVTNALINDNNLVDILKNIALNSKIFDKKDVIILKDFSMGGEDFAEYLKKVKGCYFYLGAGNFEKGLTYDWHHPKFNIDENALEVGGKILLKIANNIDKII
jgi:amidohydrolase